MIDCLERIKPRVEESKEKRYQDRRVQRAEPLFRNPDFLKDFRQEFWVGDSNWKALCCRWKIRACPEVT